MSAKKHHYVPKFYLRKYATDTEQIRTVRLPGDRWYTSSITDTGSENRFYTIPQNIVNPESLEDAFGEIENAAAPVLRDIEAGKWPLSLDDRVAVAAFVTMQALRGPDQRRLMNSLQLEMVDRESRYVAEHGAAQWFADHGVHADEKQAAKAWQLLIRADEPFVEIDAAYHAGQIGRLAETVLPHILARRWSLIKLDIPSLITSDAPVSLNDVRDGRPGPWGLLNAPTISFPLSRTMALILAKAVPAQTRLDMEAVVNGAFDSVVVGTGEDAKRLNERTAHNAGLAVFHHPSDEALVPTTLPRPRE
ncbi:DUF4238 domain-containing protein [Clavibacter michiganensis]|uniref:DUF4238 domain-containing protein n=2 Tax=Clavibacter michiganensis TaxID=28447 RepID=UPI000B569A28|nr:DUF4238 domain-containing protein [Clavibacter michiganensis]MDO4030884.1 DUF4238 domain-containing protein [Clavibacter michiganensis]MDO4080292.1 DUF4238 domain-containing protein [Clavibacter michiganensis]MDO4087654.1 DUF4238 domain-containing protein [Clavibacter michiganensis]MDO4095720.1 DUF4238 domain-containing protein [Clavibacter michiganensis]OUD95203.1 hypothetical protein CMMCAS04_04515 [Clavibacter michiganensis subsp. michiganensis]